MPQPDGDAPEPQLFGVLVTFRRSEELEWHLACLSRQTRALDHLVVVDNAPSPLNAALVDAYGEHAPVTYVESPDNAGPAGGIALGLREVLRRAGDADWVALFDDDNPPRTDEVLEWVFDFSAQFHDDGRVAAVGLTGGRFDFKRARMVRLPDKDLHGVIDVDCIGGNQFPIVRLAAIRDVGVFRSELFWGFEELDFGLRLRAHGYRILVSGDLFRWAREVHGRLGLEQPAASAAITRRLWRQYYSLRNLIDILRRNGHSGPALRVAATRGVGKALVNTIRHPRHRDGTLRLSIRAVRDGWGGRLGRTVEPS